ncbi:MAG TPA: hypothetical protein VFG73_00975 [Rhodanobacteraceae bacterium]|nr:hypothetical protein [Rhodanobacteraceae bacterium]
MRVSDIEIASGDGYRQLSARIDHFHLWYRVPPDCPLSDRGDAFVAAALLPAMHAGEPLEIEGAAVSPMLLRGAERVQAMVSRWDRRFRRIEIRAETAPAVPTRPGVGCFFSGGIDGTYTLLRHQEEIDCLVFVKGLDMQVENDALFEASLRNNRKLAEHFGKPLLSMATNIRHMVAPRGLSWCDIYGGCGLASITLALGFPRMYIASSQTYEHLTPHGSHPLLDPCWSTEALTLVHDGCDAARSEKLRAVARVPGALESLRVCWQDDGYNCGRCEKCLRTMLALRLLGLRSDSFPPLRDLAPIRRLRVIHNYDAMAFEDNLRLARQVGDHEAAAILEDILRRHRIKRAVLDLDLALTGGRGKRTWRALRPAPID